MAAILERIVAATRARVAEARRGADLRELEQAAERHVPRGFRRALAAKSRDGVAVIAELKKASPVERADSGGVSSGGVGAGAGGGWGRGAFGVDG